ncbi:MAG TPA: adenosine deaminase [Acidimicrobiales bacterium]|nr:adenosine deaminase [Acidimicrobiales bacterium]
MTEAVASPWIAAMPKAEVHLHLEGCLEPAVVAEAARRAGTTRPRRVSNLAELLAYLDWSCALIDRAEDLTATAHAAARRAGASGVRHIDIIVNPTHWPHFAGRLDTLVGALDDGFAAAESEGLATAALCLSLKRTQTRAEADALVDWMLERRHPRVAALSIDGDETKGSHTERFVDAFARARRGGLRRCAHAGESSGPGGVREAIELLGAERVDHGVRVVEDDPLVTELVDRRVPLDVCPTSNVVLGVVPDLPRHPVDLLLRRGVRLSLNTDDPLLFDVDVAGEYTRCAAAFAWGAGELTAVARTSIESCFADEDRRHQMLAELDAFVAAEPAGAGDGPGPGEARTKRGA